MSTLQIERVNALPGTIAPSTLYIVKSVTNGLVEVYFSNNDGSEVRHLLTRDEILALVESTASTLVTLSASRDALLTDDNNLLICDSASPVTLTIQDDATTGWADAEVLAIYQKGTAAPLFVAGTNVTFRNDVPVSAQYGTIGIQRVGANEWAYL